MKFPEKLWLIVNECESGAIGWGIDGESIFIDYIKFEKEFLSDNSYVFKTKNIVSFVRQLNLYGFRKSNRHSDIDVHEFKNPYFIRGKKDLLQLMRRKLGYTLGNESSNRKARMGDSKMLNEKNRVIPFYLKSAETASPPGTSNSIDYPLPSFQGWNFSPYNWWGSSYYPMMNYLNQMTSPFPVKEGCASSNVKEDQGDNQKKCAPSNVTEDQGDNQKKDDSLSGGSLDMCRNIVFVPVPAQYGMYPGLFNTNPSMPFAMQQQNENNTSEE